MCIYEICGHIFLFIPFFIPIFVDKLRCEESNSFFLELNKPLVFNCNFVINPFLYCGTEWEFYCEFDLLYIDLLF